jgi:CO/xanthine dehydrogenase FAD-binding subunit
MGAYLPDYRVINPRGLSEALDALACGDPLVPLAGGTDLMVYLEAGALPPCTFLNLQAVEELHRPLTIHDAIRLGPLTTFRDARVTPALRQRAALLALAAREVGVLAIQSRGTWAGNIANASPAADGVPALMAYDAEVELLSKDGCRRVALSRFYSGYKQTERRPQELISAIHLPLPGPDWIEYYRKVGARRFQAISKVVFAGRRRHRADGLLEDVRIVLGSVAPYTLRATATESVLRGCMLTPEVIAKAQAALQEEIHPIDDVRSTAAYRRRVAGNLLQNFLGA